MDPLQAARCQKYLAAIFKGNTTIRTSNDATRFIAALCNEENKIQCLARLCTAQTNLQAVKLSTCIDLSCDFLNNAGAQLITYCATEDLRQINSGEMLRDLLTTMLTPPLIWQAYKKECLAGNLSDAGLSAFTALALELLILLPPSSQLANELKVVDTARMILKDGRILVSNNDETRKAGYRLQDALRTSAMVDHQAILTTFKPGGRHDNDFDDFRQIGIFPTKDELLSQEKPFMLPAESVSATPVDNRVTTYLDNQFRLLREDMLAELREDLQMAMSKSQGNQRVLKLNNLQLYGLNCGTPDQMREACILLRCWDTKLELRDLGDSEGRRKSYFKDNKNFIKHGTFGCLVADNRIMSFAMIERDEDLLAMKPSRLLLRILGKEASQTTLIMLKTRNQSQIQFIGVDTPFFAYEPILKRLQQMPSVPLADAVLGLKSEDSTPSAAPFGLDELAGDVMEYEGDDLREIIDLPMETRLDHAQTSSLVAGLTHEISLIQGPPGTGKSFIGAILAKCFYQFASKTKILVLTYTNHALDQILEDILDVGVPQNQILRLGSKSTTRTKPMTLYEQPAGKTRLPHSEWLLARFSREEAEDLCKSTNRNGANYAKQKPSNEEILAALEFSDHETQYAKAFAVPENVDGMQIVGRDGKTVDATYLIDRWISGQDAGIYQQTIGKTNISVWSMKRDARRQKYECWIEESVTERAQALSDEITEYNTKYNKWQNAKSNRATEAMQTHRIIGCTTTAAAKYADQIALVKPGIVLVEEAGEVLESHVVAAMTRDTKQLVLIGDHRQLRPKIKNYALTVEKGDGFDLNRSLFERLILAGHPHSVLRKQHRMRPEISTLVRRLMYPDLEDSDRVLKRPQIRGLQSDVIFIDHHHAEIFEAKLKDRLDEGSTVSRQNLYEVHLAMKIVKYLAQQGYGTEQQVVLTPYLGQLRLMFDELKKAHQDPVLSDLDSHDLVKAGLVNPAGAAASKRSLRVSTIDNFQGEESDIIIVSLTRSNNKGDIGFMNAPERLNVLLSRARNGLIIIGNAKTFQLSKKGSKVWNPFFQQLIQSKQFFDGLPVKCQRHPDRMVVLKTPEAFDEHCPNGGCNLPCGAVLNCGKHRCPEKCHQLVDHSNVTCGALQEDCCPKDHKLRWRCYQSRPPCRVCERDEKLEEQRQQQQDKYYAELAAIETKIAEEKDEIRRMEEDTDRRNTLRQKSEDLVQVKKLVEAKKIARDKRLNEAAETEKSQEIGDRSASSTSSNAVASASETTRKAGTDKAYASPAYDAWRRQKAMEDADNPHIDAIMKLIGLESVKEQVLNIKDKVDTTVRQGAKLTKERFGALLLGNPGTGKTTVARQYAKCLASMGVVSGNSMQETTASKIANLGVAGYRKIIDSILNAGGGTLFVDEAYQLASGQGGGVLLDAMMDDIENLTGKVVFIFAGYRKEMEAFLAHNPGLTSRLPYELSFQDYEDHELLEIFKYQLKERFEGNMKIENGLDGLYTRIVARRVGYGRGKPGFGNARAMENALAKITTRQSARVSKSRREGEKPDDFELTKEDMLGPEPSIALEECEAWQKLQQMIGLDTVKQSVRTMMDSLKINYEKELQEEPLISFNLNRVFLGSPGTGKTTVAKLYGRILADLGLLSNGEVMVKNPADFVGDAIGVSEKTTKGILNSGLGKVLIIDEAYGLHGSSDADIYKSAVVDTIVAEVQSVPGDDRCVLLLGYTDEMEKMLRDANPGLARRFPIAEAFVFEDFTDEELEQILQLKLKGIGYTMTEDAIKCTIETLQRARNKRNFGNAGEVDIILNTAKQRHLKRINTTKIKHSSPIEAIDIDPRFGQGSADPLSITKLFSDTVGHEDLIARLGSYQKAVSNIKLRGSDPRDIVPYNFVFAGPPGTGKTTTARKIGMLYHDMGILATNEVLERSASDLVGQYVGHTGPKTKHLLEEALGKVLLIDEAYRLTDGPFAKEAIDELVDLLTKPQFSRKSIVILAGYDRDIQQLMATNPGLTSRFNETVHFQSLKADACIALLLTRLDQKRDLDTTEIQDLRLSKQFATQFETLANIGDWANARDVETLATTIARKCLVEATSAEGLITVTKEAVQEVVTAMIEDRQRRAALLKPAPYQSKDVLQQQLQDISQNAPQRPVIRSQSRLKSLTETNTQQTEQDAVAAAEVNGETEEAQRDADVSDAVWQQLLADKAEAERQEQHFEEVEERLEKIQREQDIAEAEVQKLPQPTHEDNEDEDDEERRREEQKRIERINALRRLDEEKERLRREKEEMEARRAQESIAQQKLRLMGLCVAGYRWIKQKGGYRCTGGSHYVSDAQLDACED